MMLSDPPLLLADIRELIGSLVGLLLLVLWVIGQLTEGKKKAKQQAAQRPAPAAKPPRPEAAQGAAAPQGPARPQAGVGLRGEMEEFLRRAAAQKGGAQPAAANRPKAPGRPQPAGADKVEVLVDDAGRVMPSRTATDRGRTKERRPVVTSRLAAKSPGAAVPSRRAPSKRESVAEHVQQHVAASTRAMAEQASHLGQRIVADDAAFDVQLKAKFDHEVGTLATAARSPETTPDLAKPDELSPAGQLGALLTSPGGIRQAILINEILRRPSERW